VNAISAATFGKFTYTEIGTTIAITNYPDAEIGAVTIPSTSIGKPVTSIGSSAFKSCTGLISVTIPNGVRLIGSSAFSGCTGLTSVTIGDAIGIIIA
jgi:hypothetical protein